MRIFSSESYIQPPLIIGLESYSAFLDHQCNVLLYLQSKLKFWNVLLRRKIKQRLELLAIEYLKVKYMQRNGIKVAVPHPALAVEYFMYDDDIAIEAKKAVDKAMLMQEASSATKH